MKNRLRKSSLRGGVSVIALGTLLAVSGGALGAGLPSGGHFVSGRGTIDKASQSLIVKQSSTTGIVDWRSFSVGKHDGVTFDNGSGATLNRVTVGNLSRIAGSLHATGSLYLVNDAGVIVSGTGRIVTSGDFAASTGSLSDSTFASGDDRFSRAKAAVINRGTILVSGDVRLSGCTVKSTGSIRASGVDVEGTDKLVIGGAITARDGAGAGGTIIATAKRIEVSGDSRISASGTRGGTILIGGDIHGGAIASDDFVSQKINTAQTTIIGAGARIQADGTKTKGGNVVIWSDGHTTFAGQISAKGEDAGGFAEVSSHRMLGFTGRVDLTSAKGQTGELLLDPENVTIGDGTTSNGTLSGGTFTPSGDDSVLSASDLEAALAGANVTVTTGSTGHQHGDITVYSDVTWTSGNKLTLDAAGNISIYANISGGVLELDAGGNIYQGNEGITVHELIASGESLYLGSLSNAVSVLGNISAQSYFAFKNGAALAINGTITVTNPGANIVAIDVDGPLTFNGALDVESNHIRLEASGDISINAQISNSSLFLYSASGDVSINAPLSGSTVYLSTSSGNVSINAPISGSNGSYVGIVTRSGDISINAPLSGPNVEVTSYAGSVTQKQPITAKNLSLEGGGGSFVLTNPNNDVGNLSTYASAVALNNGSNSLTVRGTVTGTLALTDTGSVRQGSESGDAIIAGNLTLQGNGGDFVLLNDANSVNVLAANTGTVVLNNGSSDLSIGTVNGIAGVTANTVVLEDAFATVTQSAPITASSLLVDGLGTTYELGEGDNNVGVLAASTDTVTFNNGNNNLSIGTVEGVNGANVGTLSLTDTAAVTQTQAVTADSVSLLGAGGSFNFPLITNNIANLVTNTGSVTLNDGGSDLSISSGNGGGGAADDRKKAPTKLKIKTSDGHSITVGRLTADTVDLISSGSITERKSGDIHANEITGSSDGKVELDGTNQIADLGSFDTRNHKFSLVDDRALVVTDKLDAGSGAIDLTTEGENYNLDIDSKIVGGTLNFVTTGKAKESSTGAIVAKLLNVTAQTGIELTSTKNKIKKLGTDKTKTGPNKVTL